MLNLRQKDNFESIIVCKVERQKKNSIEIFVYLKENEILNWDNDKRDGGKGIDFRKGWRNKKDRKDEKFFQILEFVEWKFRGRFRGWTVYYILCGLEWIRVGFEFIFEVLGFLFVEFFCVFFVIFSFYFIIVS